ncbi:MAG: [FeFe] hydrogenase H-cluster maturation GTPase HydF [Peptoniphilaceae bacterium]|nr:[FeFe] hydrogenase H-cluster maturation GTPase HydF [Peptoniphilaceae bacterium]MDY3738590.1 [FeFe] hydrogenase H-cluster maturation GTPase HydF [Peptoniphilaceae bacterium]
MIKTPKSLRIHIGIFGKRNTGKSSFLNSITEQYTSIVSDVKGTTTDPIYKSVEIPEVGPVVFIDTAGFDEEGELGKLRVEKTKKVIDKCDGFIYLLSDDFENEFLKLIKEKKKPIIYILSKSDKDDFEYRKEKYKNYNFLEFNSKDNLSKKIVLEKIKKTFKTKEERTITQNLVKENDTVILVMPQDIEAPKGRLILPQVSTIREILDKKANAICTGIENLNSVLNSLKKDPDLIITDSKLFSQVYKIKPEKVKLTSFSVLFSAFKGDLKYFVDSVKKLDNPNTKKILIFEACSHPPVSEDIGTVKIPKMLKNKRCDLEIDFQRGDDFFDIEKYDLIIQCGSCMHNRSQVMSRVDESKRKNIAMTNYGITIAYLNDILEKIALPEN